MMYSNAINAQNFCLVYQQPWRVSSRKMDQIRKRICKFLRRQTKHDDCLASLFLSCSLSWKEDDCVTANESSVFSNQSILLWASPLAKAPACASAKDSLSSKSSFFFPRLSRGSGERSVFCTCPLCVFCIVDHYTPNWQIWIQGIVASQRPGDGDKNIDASWRSSQVGFYLILMIKMAMVINNNIWLILCRLVFQDRVEE